MQTLSLGGNGLTGPIPAALASLGELRELRLRGNQLSGPIPASLGALPDLQHLDLRDNQLTGPIPEALRLLDHAEALHLGGNPGLSGCLPAVLRDVPDNDLDTLSLPDCPAPPPADQPCMNGVVVAEPADNPGLVGDCAILLAALGALRGDASLNWAPATPITEWDGVSVAGEPPRVTTLEVAARPLTGYIPPQLGGLTTLRELHLGHTRLSGVIPAELGALSNLELLRVHDNRLTGPIPPALGVAGAVAESCR